MIQIVILAKNVSWTLALIIHLKTVVVWLIKNAQKRAVKIRMSFVMRINIYSIIPVKIAPLPHNPVACLGWTGWNNGLCGQEKTNLLWKSNLWFFNGCLCFLARYQSVRHYAFHDLFWNQCSWVLLSSGYTLLGWGTLFQHIFVRCPNVGGGI